MPVYQDSGPSLGEGLLGAVQAYGQARRQKRADQMFEQDMADRFRARSLQEAQLAQQGVHLLKPGEMAPTWLPKAVANDATSRMAIPDAPELTFSPEGGAPTMQPKAGTGRAAAGAANIPNRPASMSGGGDLFQQTLAANLGGMPNRGPRYEVGQGYWLDKQPQWDAQDATMARTQNEKLFEAMLTDALANRGMTRDVTKAQLLAPIDVAKARDTAAAVAPIDIGKAIETARGLSPITTQTAINTARGTAPIDVQKAIATAAGVAPIDVKKAVDIETATLPGKVQLAEATAGAKQATDGERMASGFAARMATAGQTLQSLESKPGFVKTLTGTLGSPGGSGKLPLIGNFTLGKDAQLYKQAQANWVRANLRKESGAAIGDDEMAEEIRTYFPQPGDSDAVVAQKLAARGLAESNMQRNAGNAWDASMQKLYGPKTKPASDTSSTIDLGGDTAFNPFSSLIPKKP